MDIMLLACPPTPQIEKMMDFAEKVTAALGGKVTALCVRSDIAQKFYSPFSIQLGKVDAEEEEKAFQQIKAKGEVKKLKRGGEFVSSVLDELEKGGYDMLIFADYDPKVTRRIAEHATVPVLVVKRSFDKIEKILTCTDGSDAARMSCLLGSRIAKVLGAELTMLSVAPEFMDEEYARECELACAYVAREKVGIEPKTICKVGKGVKSVREEILKEAPNHDLVVCGSRGLSHMERVLMGHVSLGILEKADTNVLIVRGYEE